MTQVKRNCILMTGGLSASASLVETRVAGATLVELSMSNEKNPSEIVKMYRDPANSERLLVEILGEPIVALKQMKAEPWLLKEQARTPPPVDKK